MIYSPIYIATIELLPHQPMWFGIAVESGDAFVGLPDSNTVLPVAMEVDWMHIYAYKG